jgi:hypothetical protein
LSLRQCYYWQRHLIGQCCFEFPVKFIKVKNPCMDAVFGNAATRANPDENVVPTEAPAFTTAVTAPRYPDVVYVGVEPVPS